jgi:predicted Ser/Thr protein kinase
MNTERPDRWRRINDLFHAALERPADEREAFLAEVCGGDASLRDEVASLVASHERADAARIFESPALANDPDLLGVAGDDAGASLKGKAVGPYRVLREIGRGGMGVVYLAEDSRLGRTVALKALPPSVAADPSRRERLRREARAAAALSHPAVAVVYALEEIDGALFIASEYIEGRSLRAEIDGGPLAPDVLASTARAIASALVAAHTQGIVHRDLKPENVIRRSDGQVKVLDFGLAKMVSSDAPTAARLTEAGAIVGTPGYMAPEQLRGEPADARADVFAFGVMLYELAIGVHPFSDPLRSRELAPAAFDRLVRRCLQSNPADRYPDGGALAAALEGALAPKSRPPTPAEQKAASRARARAFSPRWWWQFHQLAISVWHGAMLYPVWLARDWLDRPWRSLAFFAALSMVISSATMRLHLRFASRVHPQTLAAERARFFPWIAAADLLYALILCALAVQGADGHDALAALLLAAAIISVLSLFVIEPATTRAAFPRSRPRRSPTPSVR